MEKLSGLPLAIVQVAESIQRRQLSLEEFLEFYAEEAFRAEIYEDSRNVFQKPIWAVLAFNDLTMAASALMDSLCFFNPDSRKSHTQCCPSGRCAKVRIRSRRLPKEQHQTYAS